MGFLDSLQSSVNRGMAATGRATSTMKLKAQMSEALKRRQALAAQLGASLYDVTKDDANLRAGREALYDGIAACDAERAQCQVEIERLEAESAAATAANSYYVCPFCGSHVVTTDLFCSGCGKPMAEITAALSAQQQAPAAPVAPVSGAAACPQCGAPVNAGDAFCMSCGYNLAAAPASAADAASDLEPAVAPVPEPAVVPMPEPADEAASLEAAPMPEPLDAVASEPAAEAEAIETVVAPAPASVTEPAPEPIPAAAPAANVCPNCGTPCEPGDAFCMGCGARLS